MAWKDGEGEILGTVNSLKSFAESNGEKVLFAMNGGMYTRKNTPCGLYVEKGVTIRPLDTHYSGGNYGMPFGKTRTNGVFLVSADGQAKVMRSIDYSESENPEYATQSGPLLVYNNSINSNFEKDSQNVLVRNAVGVTAEGDVVFVISEKKGTNFYSLASLFRDELNCPNALYLDGVVSEMYVKGEREVRWRNRLGVLIYASEPQTK